MFSQLTQLASKFSLDNLQEEPKENSIAPSTSTTHDPYVKTQGFKVSDGYTPKTDSVADFKDPVSDHHNLHALKTDEKREVEQLQSVLQNLKEEFRTTKSSLSLANTEIDRLQEELRVETSANKDLYSRYQALLSTNAAESATIRSLRDEINSLQTQLMTERSSVESLKGQLALRTATVIGDTNQEGEDTSKKTPKKVIKKKKNTAVDSSDAQSPSVSEKISSPSNSDSLNSKNTEIIAQYETELISLRNSLQILEENAAETLQSCEAKHQKTQGEMTQRIFALQEDISRLHQELNEKEDKVTSLTSENAKVINDATDKYQKMYQEFSRRVTSLQEQVADKDNRISSLNSKHQDADQDFTVRFSSLQQQCDEKDRTISSLISDHERLLVEKDQKINDLTTKFTGLTDKAKDYVKKYSEAKGTISNLEDLKAKLSEDIAQITALKEAKESEIVGLKLKLNAYDDMSSSQRSAVQDVTERLAEVQRELQRSKSSLQDSNNTIEVLQRDLEEAEESLTQANSRVDAVYKQSALDKELYTQEMNTQLEKKNIELDTIKMRITENIEIQNKLNDEVALLKKEKLVGESASKSLDEYKKKAQAALKMSSETVTNLNADISTLKKQVDISDREIKELNSICAQLRQQRDADTSEINRLKSEVESLKSSEEYYQKALNEQLEKFAAVSKPVVEAVDSDKSNFNDDGSRPAERVARELAVEITQAEAIVVSSNTSSPQYNYTISKNQRGNDEIKNSSDFLNNSFSPPISAAQSNAAKTSTQRIHEQGVIVEANTPEIELSDGIALPAQKTNNLMYISEITQQLDRLRVDFANCSAQRDAIAHDLREERSIKNKLNDRLEECLAFLERAKKLQSGPESAINMEYLKNCVLHYMLSTSVSERLRLYPVIGTILKFTTLDMSKLQLSPLHVDEIAASIESAGSSWSSITGLASSSLQGLFNVYGSTVSSSANDTGIGTNNISSTNSS